MKQWIVMRLNHTDVPASREIVAIKNTRDDALKAVGFEGAYIAGREGGYVYPPIVGTISMILPLFEIQPFDDVELMS